MRKLFVLIAFPALLMLGIAITEAYELGPNLESKAIKKVPPTYPPLAKRKQLEGTAKISLQISSDGHVVGAEFVEGNSMFKPASLEAAKQWEFSKSSSGMSGYILFKFQLEVRQ